MSTIVETIGSGGDYADISAWISATTASANIQVGELIDPVYEVAANTLDLTDTGRLSSKYRFLRNGSSIGRFLPHTNAGPKVYIQWTSGNGSEEGFNITEDFFRMEGIGIFLEDPNETAWTGAAEKVGVLVDGASSVRINACYVIGSEGGDRDQGGTQPIYCIKGKGATDLRIYDTIVQGSKSHRGALVGINYDATCVDGGMYNCAAIDFTNALGSFNRSIWSLVVSANQPELINCVSISGNAPGSIRDFVGQFSRYGHLISGDASAVASFGGVNSNGDALPDPFSLPNQPRATFARADVHDFRPTAVSSMRGAGNNEGGTFTSGIQKVEDYTGVAQPRQGGSWSIGPFEAIGSPPTSAPTRTVTNITELSALGAWITATEGLHLYNDNEVQIAQVSSISEIDLTAATLKLRRTISDSRRYRRIEPASGNRYSPRLDTGARITTTAVIAIDVREDFAQIEGIRIADSSTSSSARTVVRVRGDYFSCDSLAIRMASGTSATNTGLDIEGKGSQFSNLSVAGAGNSANGLTTGINAHDCEGLRLYYSVVDKIDGNSATGIGVHEGLRCIKTTIEGIVSVESRSADFTLDSNPVGAMSHCASSDATAVGPGSQTSVVRASIFYAPTTGDYRLPATSSLLRAGGNPSARFARDVDGKARRAPFDLGIYEGVRFGTPMPGQRFSRSGARINRLVEIRRRDGVSLYFTDASEPLLHKGNTYIGLGGLTVSNLRQDTGQSSSTEFAGGIDDDSITIEDLIADRFENAQVIISFVHGDMPSAEPVREHVSFITNVQHDSGVWRTEAAGIASGMENPVGGIISKTCPADLGDQDCLVDTFTDTIDDVQIASVVRTRREILANTTDVSGSYPDDFFGNGLVIWQSGANFGLISRIKVYEQATRRIVLQLETKLDIDSADTFQLVVGCRKRYQEDCIAKFSNGPNFQGDPLVPTSDELMETPNP